jgi:hypothetical protein
MKTSFRDPETGVLQAQGYMDFNEDGDIAQEEWEEFDLQPGKVKWDGGEWTAAVNAAAIPLISWP